MNFENTKILITGADGFIGSHLTEMFLSMGCKVRALAMYNSFNNWGWLEQIGYKENLEIVTGDIRDAQFCRGLTKDIDIVFHLAALIAIPYSYQAPYSYIQTNVEGTMNICQAALESGCNRVIHTSTSEVYGTAQYVPIDEKHPLQPQSPYSGSKIGADMMALSYHNSFDLQVVVARPFNTYGPRQSARAVIPTVITQIASGMNQIKLGDVSPTRDFNFVLDTCRGLIQLAACDDAIGEVVNIGSNYEISILDTCLLIREIMNSNIEISFDDIRQRPKKSEVHRLWCDNSKIKKLTGFEPEYSIREGLKRTIEWFVNEENLKKYKPEIYNV